MLPKFLQSALWSYDLNGLDLKNKADKRIVIEQILNYGNEKQLEWVLKNCSKNEIQEVIKNPKRGIWLEKALNLWSGFYQVRISEDKYQKAIMRLEPKWN